MISVEEILLFLDESDCEYKYVGNTNIKINGFSSLNNYKRDSITWVKKQNMLNDTIIQEDILLAIVQEGVQCFIPNIIITKTSKRVFFDVLEHFYGEKIEGNLIGENTYISSNVKLGHNVRIGHNCTIDGDIEIGDNTRIYNNVNIINKVRIGKNCIIQSCVNIGHDGFAYTENENHTKSMVKHYGGTVIGNNVYIGGNTCIERGTIDDTIIRDGSKIDVTCTIGHNSVLEENVALVGGTILLGSVKLKENAFIASGLIRNQSIIGRNSIVGMGSVVTKDVEDNTVVIGVPAKELRKMEK